MSKSFINDFQNAKERIIVSQARVSAKKVVLAKASKHFPKMKNRIASFLETDTGSALISTGLGFVFACLPSFRHKTYAKLIAKEFKSGSLSLLNIARKNVVSVLKKV